MNRWTVDEQLFIWLVVINTIIAIVYFLVGAMFAVPARKRAEKKAKDKAIEEAEARRAEINVSEIEVPERFYDNRRTYFIRTFVMILCPVIGPLYFLVSYLLYMVVFRSPASLDDVTFSKERVRTQVAADEEREMNVMPLEEAVELGDTQVLRQAVLNMLKGGHEGSLVSVKLVMKAHDPESSHYAASVLSKSLNEFRINAQRLFLAIKEENDDQTECEAALIDYLDTVLSQDVFSKPEQVRFTGMMDNAAESYFTKKANEMPLDKYKKTCLALLGAGMYASAEKWADRMLEHFPNDVAGHSCKLKLYFMTKDQIRFFAALEELKKSDTVIDHETLQMVRTFG